MRKIVVLLLLIATCIVGVPLTSHAQQAVRWETTLDSAQRIAGQTNRLVLIQFWAPWCGVCKRLEAEVLSQPAVATEMTANFVAVRINADQFPVTARRYGVTALPTTVITSPDGTMLDHMRGWMSAQDYMARLDRVASDARQRASAAYAQIPGAPAASPSAQPAPASRPTNPAASNHPPANPNLQPAAPPTAVAVAPQQPIPSPSPTAQAPAAIAAAPRYGESRATAPTNQGPSAYANPGQQPPAQGVCGSPAGNPMTPATPASPQTPPAASPTNGPYVGQTPPALPPGSPPLGLDGFCCVSLCDQQKWVRGDRRWGAIHRGRTYLFAGPDEQRRFLSNPDRYAPLVSGNDIVLAAEQGRLVAGSREHGVFFGSQIFLFSSEETLDKFKQNPDAYAKQAIEALRAGNANGQWR